MPSAKLAAIWLWKEEIQSHKHTSKMSSSAEIVMKSDMALPSDHAVSHIYALVQCV